MIARQRPRSLAPPAWLTKADAETATNLATHKRAVAAFRQSKKKEKTLELTFQFRVYGDESLREALNKVYGFKCAYCESDFGATQPVAVEHYRPKGEVVDGDKSIKPGYYWLAATWENLLPSCTDCNSQRYQTTGANGESVLRGKGNLFPLKKGSRRAKSPTTLKNEVRLLLHPELDDPAQHLEFATDTERLGVIRPKVTDGIPSEMGAVSIEVYALDRPRLVQTRQSSAKRLLSHIRNTIDSERRYRAQPGDAGLKQAYDDNLSDLAEFIGLNQAYTAMGRQIALSRLPALDV